MKFLKKRTPVETDPRLDAVVADLSQEDTSETDGPPRAGRRKFGWRGKAADSASADEAKAARKRRAATHDMHLEERGVLTFGKVKTAVALSWTSLDDGMNAKAKVAEQEELSAEDPTQRSVSYKYIAEMKQTGFIGMGSEEWGQKAGMRALVTMLTPQATGPRWLGVFAVDDAQDVWWIASIRDGKIFEDQIIRSRTVAEQTFLRNLEAPDWTSVFAPYDWGIPHTKHNHLTELVDLKLGYKLKSITPLKDNLPRILLGGLVATIAICAYVYLEHQRAERERELAEMRRRAEAGMTYSPQDLPWHNSTPLAQFVETCIREIDRSIILQPGWEAQPISCTVVKGAGTISTGWERAGGRMSWLRSAVAPDEPAPVLASNGNSASWSRAFSAPVDETAIAAEPWEGDVIESRMRERFIDLDIPLAIRPTDSNQRLARAAPVFNSHDMRLSGAAGIANFGDILEDVPALVPQALIYNPQTGNWDLAIKVFHPPLLPPPAY